MRDYNDYKNAKGDASGQNDVTISKEELLAAMARRLRDGAAGGDPEMQYALGDACLTGFPVPEDPVQGASWIRKAADQGYAKAQSRLALCYSEGHGVEKDFEQAVYWARKAANQGDAVGQIVLGDAYGFGRGVEIDLARAAYWYEKAADQGLAHAQCSLGICYYNGDGVPEDDSKAAELFRKAAEQNHASACLLYGKCFENGHGVKADLTKAVEWYQKAADLGDDEAPEYLDKARKTLREQQEAEERRKKEAAEKAERDRIRAMWDARDTSMETWAIVASVVSVAALFGEKWLMTHKGPFLMVLVEMAAVALSVIAITAASALFTGSFSEVLAIPGGIGGFLAGLVAVILNGYGDKYPHVIRTVMIAAVIITAIMILRIIVKKSRPKP